MAYFLPIESDAPDSLRDSRDLCDPLGVQQVCHWTIIKYYYYYLLPAGSHRQAIMNPYYCK